MDRDYKTGKSKSVGVFSGLEIEHTPVTVDYPHSLHSQVKEKFKTLWNNPLFIPFCSIIFPHSEDDEQLYIKVDDVDFNATGPGVWTMSMNHFKQTSGFTSWKEYNQDEPMEYDYAKKENKKAV